MALDVQKREPPMSTPPRFAVVSASDYRVIFRDGSEWHKQHMVHLLYFLMGPEHAEQLNGVVHDFHVAAEHYCKTQTTSKDGICDIVKHYRDFVQVLIILDVRTGKPLVLTNTSRHGTKLMEHARIATQLLENLHYDSPRWQRMRQDCLALVACGARTPRLLFTNYKIELLFRKKSQDDKLRTLLEGTTLLHRSEFEQTIAEAVSQGKAPREMVAWCTNDVAGNPRLCTSLAILAMMADKVCMDYSAEDCWSMAPLEQVIKDHKDDVEDFSRERALNRQVGLVLMVDGQRCTFVKSAAGCIGIEKDDGCRAAKRAKLAPSKATADVAGGAACKATTDAAGGASSKTTADAAGGGGSNISSKSAAQKAKHFPVFWREHHLQTWMDDNLKYSSKKNHQIMRNPQAKIEVAPLDITVEDIFHVDRTHANSTEGLYKDVTFLHGVNVYKTGDNGMLVMLRSLNDLVCTWALFESMRHAEKTVDKPAYLLAANASDKWKKALSFSQEQFAYDRIVCLFLPVRYMYQKTAWSSQTNTMESYRSLTRAMLVGTMLGVTSISRQKLFCMPWKKLTGAEVLPVQVKTSGKSILCRLCGFSLKQHAQFYKYVQTNYAEVAEQLSLLETLYPLLKDKSIRYSSNGLRQAGMWPGGSVFEGLKQGKVDAIRKFCYDFEIEVPPLPAPNLSSGAAPSATTTSTAASAAAPSDATGQTSRLEQAFEHIRTIHTVYHGTTLDNALKIIENGFSVHASRRCGRNMGDGIYCSPMQNKASRYLREDTDIMLVLKLEISLSKDNTRIFLSDNHSTDPPNGWQKKYAAAYAPPGVFLRQQVMADELCVADPTHLRIEAIVPNSWKELRKMGYVVDEDKLRRV